MTGYLLKEADASNSNGRTIRSVLSLLDETPSIPEGLLDFLIESASYYMHPIGETIRSALPPGFHTAETKGELKEARVGTRTVEVAVWIDTSPSAEVLSSLNRAKKRSLLFDAILEAREISLAELSRLFLGAKAHAKRLAADGLIRIEEREATVDPYFETRVSPDVPPSLTPEQETAVEEVTSTVKAAGYKGFLLHGVTGSGKTEVYLRIIEQARRMGKGALVLVPEIALTPQLTTRYRRRFGDALAVWHSALSARERFEQWQMLRKGAVQVAIGVRSAVFAPVENLGVIIVDEEHDSSFKQETGFRYHARDLALLRASRQGAVAVLGSATPSLESLENAARGKLTKLSMEYRATSQRLPEIQIIDRTQHRSGPNNQTVVSKPLFDAIEETLTKKEQTILFLNRRGFASALLCTDCGTLIRCDDCAVSLTFHKRPPKLICHYCGRVRPIPSACPSCASRAVEAVGTGTQKVEDILAELFPNAKIARLDRDTGGGGRAEAVLTRLRNQEIDILVGTQMVTKGHDFPHVTLVGVLNADVGLHMPDFRASERTFQLLTQVAGRAGRGELPGIGMIQTFHPKHPAVDLARTHDYPSFAAKELAFRRELGYPPFGRLALLRFSSEDLDLVESEANAVFAELSTLRKSHQGRGLALLGPSPAPLSFVQRRHHFRILIKAERQDQIRALIAPIIPRIEAPKKGVRIAVDIDPFSML
jgi:primosomal protein N' (replication factor Y)